jgi:PKD repeat protein
MVQKVLHQLPLNLDGSDGESNTQTVLRTFDIAGTYNVSLIATDSQNQVAFDSMTITIEEPEQPAVEEEQPSPESIDNGLVSNDSFGLADLMERLE